MSCIFLKIEFGVCFNILPNFLAVISCQTAMISLQSRLQVLPWIYPWAFSMDLCLSNCIHAYIPRCIARLLVFSLDMDIHMDISMNVCMDMDTFISCNIARFQHLAQSDRFQHLAMKNNNFSDFLVFSIMMTGAAGGRQEYIFH